ncbi:hypothetical protein Esti_006059 [Eimeria stiedai]
MIVVNPLHKAEDGIAADSEDEEEAGEVVMYAKLVNVALVHPPQALLAANHRCRCGIAAGLWRGLVLSLRVWYLSRRERS